MLPKGRNPEIKKILAFLIFLAIAFQQGFCDVVFFKPRIETNLLLNIIVELSIAILLLTYVYKNLNRKYLLSSITLANLASIGLVYLYMYLLGFTGGFKLVVVHGEILISGIEIIIILLEASVIYGAMKYIFKNLLRFKFAVKISTILNVSSLALGILVLIVSPNILLYKPEKSKPLERELHFAMQRCEDIYKYWVVSGCSHVVGKVYCCIKFEWIDADGDGYGDPGKREYDKDDYYNVTCDPNSQLGLKALLDARKCLNITCKDIKC